MKSNKKEYCSEKYPCNCICHTEVEACVVCWNCPICKQHKVNNGSDKPTHFGEERFYKQMREVEHSHGTGMQALLYNYLICSEIYLPYL